MATSSITSPKVLCQGRDDDETKDINRGMQKLKMIDVLDEPHASLITINFGTSSDSETHVNVTERRPTTESVIGSQDADIYFVQEITAPRSVNWCLDIDGEIYQCINTYGNTEAGIILDTTTFSLRQHIKEDEKMKIREKMAEAGRDNHCLAEIPTRTCALLVQHNESKREVLVVSWHGQWTGLPEKKEKLKSVAFKYLQEFVCMLRTDVIKDESVPIIIGGDFNLNLENVGDDFLLPQFRFPTCKQTERRETKNPFDYLVYTTDTNITINDVYPLELKQNSPNSSFNTDESADLTQKQLFGLDHDPIRGTLIFN